MKILNKNLKNAIIKIKIENLDDLWYLSTIINENDLVSGQTERKIKFGSGENTKVERKKVYIAINVEKIEWRKTTNIVKVLGKIKESSSDEVPLGNYHSFNVAEGSIIKIQKQKWLKYQLDKLNEASKGVHHNILIIVLNREEATIAILKKYGYDVLCDLKGDVQKKEENTISKGNFYEELIKIIENYVKKYEIQKIILASPAFWKEELIKKINDQSFKKKVITATCNNVGKNGIDEVLKRNEVEKALHDERISKEAIAVEKLLAEISKDGKYAYGFKEVKQCVNAGAVEKLLIVDSTILKYRENGKYNSLEKLMKLTEQMQGEIIIISHEHQAGSKLLGLGGIGAILRYRVVN